MSKAKMVASVVNPEKFMVEEWGPLLVQQALSKYFTNSNHVRTKDAIPGE